MQNTDKKDKSEPQRDEEMPGVELEGEGGRIYCLSIIGQVEGHYALDSTQKTTKYDHILPLLAVTLVRIR